MTTFDQFFKTATRGPDTPGHEPFDYQRRLALDPECRSRLIEIPTGLGKTAAVVLAWLWNRVLQPDANARKDWSRRLVYCLPMRTLVEQTQREVRMWLVRLARKHTSPRDGSPLRWLALHSPIILMGGEDSGEWDVYPECEAILIGTQDMLLSRALNRGYGMSRYRWPMHFGLLNNDCLWVMDETQLMGPALWTSAQLDWMRDARFRSRLPCKTWWMSATVSIEFLQTSDRVAEEFKEPAVFSLGAEPRAARLLAARRPCAIWAAPEPITKKTAKNKKTPEPKASPNAEFFPLFAKEVVAQHRAGTLSLVVCNTVASAQKVFQNANAAAAGNVECILLTSRFRRFDRKESVAKLVSFEEKRKKGLVGDTPGLICISTQVVEAGVDISSVRLWSEVAPWPSIAQRLGRLNRDGRDNDRAQAIFFKVPSLDAKPKKGTNNGPYPADVVVRGERILMKLIALCETEPTLSSRDAIERLRSEKPVAPEIQAALKPVPTPYPRAIDIHGLFSTEPDVFGGFTDVSPFVRGDTDRADVIVFWRDGPAKKPFPPKELSGPAFDPDEGCSVAAFRLRNFLTDHARAYQWDSDAGKWAWVQPDEVCPGMVLMLPASAGGYDRALGWTGNRKNELLNVDAPGPFSEPRDADPMSERGDWLELGMHLTQTENIAANIAKELALSPELATALTIAAAMHDIGKSLPKWQDAVPKPRPNEHDVWAKFVKKPGSSFRPKCRHEAASALSLWHRYFREDAEFPALAIYLTAAHHGKVRTVLRSRPDDEDNVCGVPLEPKLLPWNGGMEMDFSCAFDGATGEFSADGTQFVCESPGWTALVADLLGGWARSENRPIIIPTSEPACLGPFALAYFEALIRSADQRGSK